MTVWHVGKYPLQTQKKALFSTQRLDYQLLSDDGKPDKKSVENKES